MQASTVDIARPAPGTSARLFLALWPDDAATDAIVGWQSAFDWPAGARPTRRAALHVTLHFLGDVPRASLPALVAALRVPFEPFDLALDVAAVWPGGIAVLEPTAPPRELLALHARLAEVLRARSLRLDARPYRPHVTLARDAQGARTAAPPAAPVAWRAGSYALVESANGRYATLAAFGDR